MRYDYDYYYCHYDYLYAPKRVYVLNMFSVKYVCDATLSQVVSSFSYKEDATEFYVYFDCW